MRSTSLLFIWHACRTGNVAFIRMVGSEFVQKYLGEGPRMVRDVFRMAKENAPSIIFIDEIDAIATKRFGFQPCVYHFMPQWKVSVSPACGLVPALMTLSVPLQI